MNRLLLLRRMETVRRQTKAHLDLIERQIAVWTEVIDAAGIERR